MDVHGLCWSRTKPERKYYFHHSIQYKYNIHEIFVNTEWISRGINFYTWKARWVLYVSPTQTACVISNLTKTKFYFWIYFEDPGFYHLSYSANLTPWIQWIGNISLNTYLLELQVLRSHNKPRFGMIDRYWHNKDDGWIKIFAAKWTQNSQK